MLDLKNDKWPIIWTVRDPFFCLMGVQNEFIPLEGERDGQDKEHATHYFDKNLPFVQTKILNDTENVFGKQKHICCVLKNVFYLLCYKICEGTE